MIQLGLMFKGSKLKINKAKEQSRICIEMLKEPDIKEKYREALRQVNSDNSNDECVEVRYTNLAKKFKIAASRTTRVSKTPSTPTRRRAFDRFRIAKKNGGKTS